MENQEAAITFADAIEALTKIADMKVEPVLADTNSAGEQTPRSVQLISADGSQNTIQVVRNSFRAILKYLQKFYQKETSYLLDQRTIDGIKNIMVLVGEAAKKLDRYSQLMHGAKSESVTELKEFRQLQEFYQRRIAQKVDERVLSSWIFNLTQAQQPKDIAETAIKKRAKKRVFIDLDAVRKDLEYELFFLRKEDGTRYYNPRLVRNLQLVCDFGDYMGEIKQDDPLASLDHWQDRIFHATAASILKAARNPIDHYLRDAARHKDRELVDWLNKALTALVLAANPRNLMSQTANKSCSQYFADCQQFLRGALTCREYQKLVVYPPKPKQRVACALRDVVHSLCKALYLQAFSYPQLGSVIAEMIDRTAAEPRSEMTPATPWWDRMEAHYTEIAKHLKYHPNRPLRDILAVLADGGGDEWDPLHQRNLPGRLFDIKIDDTVIANIRMACPVRQGYIHKAIVNEEFKEWLRAEPNDAARLNDSHLLINLQDSTSWQEHARCKVIEELPNHKPYDQRLTTLTLAVDTDFYHQRAPYHSMHQVETFLQQFQEQLEGVGSGCFFPPKIGYSITPEWTQQLFHTIHQVFFSGRNVLSPKERTNFIELAYVFIILKAIDTCEPESFSLVCKDGVDAGSAFNTLLFAMLKVCNQDSESTADYEAMEFILYAAPLLVRERVMVGDRFHRTLDAIRCIANARADHGAKEMRARLKSGLESLYKRPWWEARVTIPRT